MLRIFFLLLVIFIGAPAMAQLAGDHQAAEERWAHEKRIKESGWRVVSWGTERVPCTPLADIVPSAYTPGQALDDILQHDPDAYMDPERPNDDQWERIIRTRGHNLRMVRDPQHCAMWNILMFGDEG